MSDRTGTCAVCGESFPLTKSWRKYCSAKCGRKGAPSNQMVTVSCVICGEQVRRAKRHAQNRDTVCSETCSSELKRRNLTGRTRVSDLPSDHPARWVLGQWSTSLRYYQCSDCGCLVCSHGTQHKSRIRCWACQAKSESGRVHQYARFIAGHCSECGQSFIRDRLQYANLPKQGKTYCSNRCARRANKARRRALKRQAFVESVNRSYIFKRDGYCCQICGKRLAMSKAAPHPKSPTLDHIIPLARGGTHESSNIQAAHFMCNALKSAGSAADQLLLLG